MAKKISRKELKEPDEFITFTTRVYTWLSEQKIGLIIGASALALVVICAYGYRWYKDSKEEKASVEFISAKKILDARVAGEGSDSASATGAGSYASEEAKDKAAIEAFEKVRKEHPGTRVADLATYFIGEINSRLGNYDKAQENFQKYLESVGESGELSIFALEGIAAALEAQGKNQEAIEQYRRLTKPPYDMQPDRGFYHVARMEQKTGKTSEAKADFEKILEKYPQTNYRREIQQRLDEMSTSEPIKPNETGMKEGAAEKPAQAKKPAEAKKPAAAKKEAGSSDNQKKSPAGASKDSKGSK